MTVPTMKWTIADDGQWVRRCFDLTTTETGKSDTPSEAIKAVLNQTKVTK